MIPPLKRRYIDQVSADVLELYQCIQKHHPIGLHGESKIHMNSESYKRYAESFTKYLFDKEQYKNWELFLESLRTSKKYELQADNMPYQGSHSAYISLEMNRTSLRHEKNIRFCVSFLGPYYTVYGEESVIKMHNKKGFRFGQLIIPSPTAEYEAPFLWVREKIEDQYKNYRFVPYWIFTLHIRGLSIYMDNRNQEDSTIFQALFKTENLSELPIFGDKLYEASSWHKEETNLQ